MSSYYQEAFNGGMNLLEDDTRLKANEYRLGLNLRNRFGKLLPVPNGVKDTAAPVGIKQDIRTFGNYIILFVAGYAYYRRYDATGWTKISGFQMSKISSRFWTEVVPVTTMKYLRKLVTALKVESGVTWDPTVGALAGNISGLVVQDNINQPQFIYLDPNTSAPVCKVLNNYDQWDSTTDDREYVPIGNVMAWVDGILYIASPDHETIYRSVSGRPLDFVVNIKSDGTAGGDAATTAYSVGVGGITCLRAMSSNALFVAASNANFAVSKNMTPGASTEFGEYTFIRTFLFNATCLSDRCIIDSLGDTRFIDLTGLRSFNAVQQLQNEGRNSPFSMLIQSVFDGITQQPNEAAAILYDNYEFYAVNTILGPVIGVFDTINQCWAAFDNNQTDGLNIKMFAKIELSIQRLYAITTNDELYMLYSGTEYAPLLRTLSVSPDRLRIGTDSIPTEWEHKLQEVKIVWSRVTDNFNAFVTPIAQNELTKTGTITKRIPFTSPSLLYTGAGSLNDMNTNIKNTLFSTPNCAQSCQTYCIIEWTGLVELMQFSMIVNDIKSGNPLRSQI